MVKSTSTPERRLPEVTAKLRKKYATIDGRTRYVSFMSARKGYRKEFQLSFFKADYDVEVIQSDIAEKIPVSLDGSEYSCSFIDQYMRLAHVGGLKHENDTIQAIQEYKQLSHVIKCFKKGVVRLHTDGGGEYSSENKYDCSITDDHSSLLYSVCRGIALEVAGR